MSKAQKIFDIRVVEVPESKGSKNKIKKAKVQFAKGVEITVNGEKVDLGEYNSVFLKTKQEVEDNLSWAVENRGLSQDFADQQVNFMEEKAISSVCEVISKN